MKGEFIKVETRKEIIVKRTVTALEGVDEERYRRRRRKKKFTCATAHSIRFIRHFSCFFYSSSPALRLLLQEKEEEKKNQVSIRTLVNSNIFPSLFFSFFSFPDFFKHFCIIRRSIRIYHSFIPFFQLVHIFIPIKKMVVFWKLVLTIFILHAISKLKKRTKQRLHEDQ